jgi:hypothetical protein
MSQMSAAMYGRWPAWQFPTAAPLRAPLSAIPIRAGDESADQSDVALFGPPSIMPLANLLPHPIEQARLAAFWRDCFTDKFSAEQFKIPADCIVMTGCLHQNEPPAAITTSYAFESLCCNQKYSTFDNKYGTANKSNGLKSR